MHFLFFIWRHKCIHTERERERRPGRLFVTLGTGISQADRADLDKALKGENSEENFPIQNMPGLCYTLLKYIMAEIPPTKSHTSGKKVVFHYDVHELNTGGYIYYSATGRRCLHYYNLTSLCWLSQSVWQTRVSKRACKSVKCTCLGKFPMPPYSKKKQFTRPNSVKIIINNNHVVHYMPFWITYKTCNNTLD